MPDEPDNNSNSNTPDGGGSDKTFTQSDVDRIVEERLKRERSKFSDYDDLKAKAQRLKQAEDADKSEIDKLKEQLSEAQNRATQAESSELRATVASEKGLTAKQAKRLTGSNREELETDADELLETFGAKTPDGGESKGDESRGDEGGRDDTSRRPREKLRPGASTEQDSEPDAGKLAENILKSPF